MNIIHIAQCAGGVDRYLSMLLPLLKKAGIYQILVCSFDYNKYEYEVKVDEIEQINLRQSLNPFFIINSILYIRTIIKKHNPDIVY